TGSLKWRKNAVFPSNRVFSSGTALLFHLKKALLARKTPVFVTLLPIATSLLFSHGNCRA
ncbi:MAG TPA: hypothetical protein PKD78_01325, partial [Saprospiraceae bacterium]|nr:hypothetical protein [Saprospiraceae bacterium]